MTTVSMDDANLVADSLTSADGVVSRLNEPRREFLDTLFQFRQMGNVGPKERLASEPAIPYRL